MAELGGGLPAEDLQTAVDRADRAAGKGAATAGGARRPPLAYFDGDDEARARDLYQLVDEGGEILDPSAIAWLDRELGRRLFAGMLLIRVTDARMIALQRQGRIGFYGEALGQEGAVVGSAAATLPIDWIVPALREAGVGLYRGMSLATYLAQIFGNAADPSKGRQLPCHPCDRPGNYVVMSSCVSTQIPHAVGIAMAMKIAGDRNRCCFGYMGDGGTSEADFHVALNFAGVTRAPAVLICQNNQWAISTPSHVQTASETIALKALGYGVEPLRVDGNDVLAVYDACWRAATKARTGGGPTFLELVTYRVSAHSSSDDPTRYRDEDITAVWRTNRDPVRRLQRVLEDRGWLAAGEAVAMATELEARVREEILAQEQIGPPPLSSLFDDVYEQLPWHLREQAAELTRP